MQRLLYDECRCMGVNCARKNDCLRHAEMNNMGPRTPWTEYYCNDEKLKGFIAILKGEAK